MCQVDRQRQAMAPLRYTARMNDSRLQQEILEQPAALQRLLDEGRASVQAAAAAIRAFNPAFVTIAARGSSDNAARYAQYLFGAQNRLPVGLATPSLYSVYASPPRLQRSLVIGISQSGQSPDIVAVLRAGREQHALTIAITNDGESPLAQVADHCILLHCGPERSVAATKTYTSSLLAIALLGAELAQAQERLDLLARIPQHVRALCERGEEFRTAGAVQRDMQSCVVLSRGYNYATAFEIALKLKELCYVLAEPWSSADFQHGPVALVEQDFALLAIVPPGPLAPKLIALLGELRGRGARLLVISAQPEALALAHTPLPLPALPEWLTPLVAVLPGQFFALGLTQAKGLDVDQPRGLSKVTRTQ